MSETLQGFAAKLKELRERAGMTQPALAERVGMNRFSIAQLEQGRRKPTWETVQALSDALGVSCEAFREPPAERAPVKMGRPPKPKEEAEPDKPKRPRGRPRKGGG
jgi:DNA-binding XRE family transcriptional regulator